MNRDSARDRLLRSATKLFVARGFDGASVRDICSDAGATVNMVSYYFGSKQGLYDEIIGSLSEQVFAGPMRILEARPRDRGEMRQVLELYANATVDALISHRDAYTLASRERVSTERTAEFQNRFIDFIETAKSEGVVNDAIDPGMLSGLIVGRIASQVVDADWIEKVTGVSIVSDYDYRKRWLKANLDIILYGMLA